MRTLLITIVCIVLYIHPSSLSAQTNWQNPIQKQERLGSPLVETSPFVFKDKLYLLENNQRFWDIAGAKPGDHFPEDEIRIRDLSSNEIVSVPLKNHAFGTVLTWKDRVYVFAGYYGENKPWRKITEIVVTSSADLKEWTKPETILRANPEEYFFNTAVCRGKDDFILLYETSDPQWTPFTFRYVRSADLKNWQEIPEAIYGTDKYVGGPALYYENGWYYTLYLKSLNPGYETHITRSRDLVNWKDAPEDRPFVSFDPSHKNIPLIDPSIAESNASDVELCYFKGQTVLYFTGSDQTTAGDLQRATFPGTPQQLFEYFFKNSGERIEDPPKHQGNWAPVLIPPEQQADEFAPYSKTLRTTPTPQQLAFQERQLGAFIHFGLATYAKADMMAVPEAALFNPSQLDAEQWVTTAKSFGAKHIVLTAKHHNGFCLWPTKTTDYSVKNSPWKEGTGDVVAEFVNACRKYDMKVGLYLSGGDTHFGCTSSPDPQGERTIRGDVHRYFPVFLEQLRELLTEYGEISYLWFDGAYDPFGWDVMDPDTGIPLGTSYGDAIQAMVRHLQPEAVIMGGTKPDVRWSGSEQGWAPYPLENVVKTGEGLAKWVGPQNAGYIPAEANLHTRSSWFWKPDSDPTLKDSSFLMKAYLESIGRGANLLVNMTPDSTGLIPQAEVNLLENFGHSIRSTFAHPVGITSSKNQPSTELSLPLPQNHRVNLLVLEEVLEKGQHVRQYTLEAWVEGQWQPVASGETIGRKRIQYFDPVITDRLRLRISGDGPDMELERFAVYGSAL
ncbi:alpha-L-fucosidase [Cyclobacterium jeungdonense]|uniref:alpha-L-fucosidase n=1 Tax=Cyclobacterium jeungdonense TaxID=708087 RepID=A0ABT8C628_9BACT|nr:alpha-L-fucosidase [Cyclobacterium jeungdonense]MDN3687136.1 alpha-L-fucosidase [Cyclobacterium jeungdonense]